MHIVIIINVILQQLVTGLYNHNVHITPESTLLFSSTKWPTTPDIISKCPKCYPYPGFRVETPTCDDDTDNIAAQIYACSAGEQCYKISHSDKTYYECSTKGFESYF